MRIIPQNSNSFRKKAREEDLSLMMKLWLRFVIWVMDAGHIITLLLRFKLDNTDHQR
jgi:hypothetical protein